MSDDAIKNLDPTTNFISHIWNNSTKERTYFREGGVHIDKFQTYIEDFINEYIDACDSEDVIYMVSMITSKEPELLLKLCGSSDLEMREHRAREAISNKMIKDYLPKKMNIKSSVVIIPKKNK